MNLTREERETIICFNEADQTASVYTHNGALRRKLEALAQGRPEDCRLERVSHDGMAVDYTIPKKWVKINANRMLTEEQREALVERGRNLASQRKTNSKNNETQT